MSAQVPLACSLSASDLPTRLADMAALGGAALVDVSSRATLRFTAGAGVRDRVEAIVAAEAQCCAFLTMRVTDAPGLVVLTVDAPGGAESVLAALVAAFRDE